MTLGDLSVDSLLDPGNLIDKLVAVVFHHVNGHAVLGVDHPDEQETVGLDLVERDVKDLLVVQGVVGNGDTSCGVGRGELPGWVNGDHIKKPSTVLHL